MKTLTTSDGMKILRFADLVVILRSGWVKDDWKALKEYMKIYLEDENA